MAHGTHTGDNLLHLVELCDKRGISFSGSGQRQGACHDAFAFLAFADVLIEFFGDEGHEGVDNLHEQFEDFHRGLQCLAVDGCLIGGLNHFQIPAGELVGKEFEHGHERLVQTVLAVQVVDLGNNRAQLCLHPLDGFGAVLGLCDVVRDFPSLDQTEGIPYLVAEGGTLSAKAFVEENVVSGRGGKKHTHAHAVGTIFLNQADGVGTVAQLL